VPGGQRGELSRATGAGLVGAQAWLPMHPRWRCQRLHWHCMVVVCTSGAAADTGPPCPPASSADRCTCC
jgi:hypothetical protein